MNKAVKGYYYLAPLWYLVEMTLWPGLRSQVLVGNSIGGRAAFYAIEAAIGAAFWMELPAAPLGALIENIIYLVSAFRFVLFTPLDIASDLDSHAVNAMALADHYVRSLPGVIFSAFQVTLAIQAKLPRPPDSP